MCSPGQCVIGDPPPLNSYRPRERTRKWNEDKHCNRFPAKDENGLEETSPKGMRKTLFKLMVIGFSVAAVSAGGWFYYYSRLLDVPPPPEIRPQRLRAEARIRLTPQASNTLSVGTPSEPLTSPNHAPESPRFYTTLNPMEEFHLDLNKAVLHELGSAFPELQNVLGVQTTKSDDPTYRRTVFQLLDAAEKMPADQRPAILLAADMVAQEIWCAMEDKTECDQLRSDLGRYQLNLQGAELGGIFVYSHDLLWRLWRDYPATDWGERAFILLLDHGWDTSPTCEKGAEQFREVIRQGETFLQQRPNSPQRGVVTLLVAGAYATWWSLSKETRVDMSDYVDAKQYQNGAEDARIKAIGYFEQVVQLAPETKLGEYARQVLPALRERKAFDTYRFYCIYD